MIDSLTQRKSKEVTRKFYENRLLNEKREEKKTFATRGVQVAWKSSAVDEPVL
jgi:hypothetical protein